MKLGGLGNFMEQAQKMQEDMRKAQEELAKKTIEASAGGGMVKVVANGKQQILSIEIDDQVIKLEDKQMLQDLIVAGVNEAIKTSQEMMSQEMKDKLTGGLGPLGPLLNRFT